MRKKDFFPEKGLQIKGNLVNQRRYLTTKLCDCVALTSNISVPAYNGLIDFNHAGSDF